MKRSLLLLLSLPLFLIPLAFPSKAQVTSRDPDPAFLQEGVPVVDIRTPTEWRQTGVIQGSVLLTFFDAQGNYDLPEFLAALKARIDTTKPFALLCQVGSRSRMVATFLSREHGFPVLDLRGGVLAARSHGVPLIAPPEP